MINQRNLLKGLIDWWGSLRITSKFGFAFGLMLFILSMQTAIAFAALNITWNSNDTILGSSESRRLIMDMSRNWEIVRRLQQSAFTESPIIGAEQASQLYAIPASGKISEVVRGGATLKRLSSTSIANTGLRQEEPVLSLILSNVSQYATVFEEAMNLELKLTSTGTGLYFQLTNKVEILVDALKSTDQSEDLLVLCFKTRLAEEKYPAAGPNSPLLEADEIFSELRKAIEDSPTQFEAKNTALNALDDYAAITDEIKRTESQIQEKLNQLETLSQSVNLSLIELMVSADNEVGQARLQIEQTRKISIVILLTAMGIGLLFTAFIGVVFHNSVTRNIVRLTQIASELKQGNLSVRSPAISSDELGHLASTFNQMAETLERRVTEVENLHVILRDQSIRDGLTGLFNRRYLDESLPREFKKVERDGIPVTLVMIDIDHFKVINDHYGHAVGDIMLVELAAILKSHSRSSDIIFRYGGEEFVILLLGANLAAGVRRADEWRQIFSNFVVQSQDEFCRATLSAGVVERHPGEPPEIILVRADAELYKAKNAGRNRVSADSPDVIDRSS